MPTLAHLVHVYGLAVVAGVIGLESIGLPFPGETVLIFAAILAGTKHDLNIVSVVLTAAAGAIVGQSIGYVIGREFGYWLLLRYGPYVGITESRIKLGEYLFLRHGSIIIVAARFVPLMRSVAGILAGANRMPWRQFLLANIVGARCLGELLRLRRLYARPPGRAGGRAFGNRHRHHRCHRFHRRRGLHPPPRGAIGGGSRTRAARPAAVGALTPLARLQAIVLKLRRHRAI